MRRLARAAPAARPSLLASLLCCVATTASAAIVLQGTSGDDVLDASSSSASHEIFGNSGNDTLIGSTGGDMLDGGPGNDSLSGGSGNDTLVGRSGNDSIAGGAGSDTIRVIGTKSGYDAINGGAATDELLGGSGDDVIGLTSMTSVELIDGRGGFNILRLAGGGRAINLSTTSVTRIARIVGGAGNDTIVASTGDDALMGGAGNDTIDGGAGTDRVIYTHPYANYSIVAAGDSIEVRDLVTNDGTDTLTSIERIEFADGVYANGSFTPTSAGNALLTALQAAPAGSWLRVNVNRFEDVWTPFDQRATTPSYMNPAKVIYAWSSMAWDSRRDRLVFWGGGHANYSGNEVYTFDVGSARWRRESLPSEVWEPLGDSQFFAVDGPRNAPTSSHTYDNQEYLPRLDRFITFGGAKFNGKQKFVLEDGVTLTGPYLWDPNRAGANSVGGTNGSQVRPNTYPSVTGAQMWDDRDTMRNRGIGSVRPSADWVNGTSSYVRNGEHDAVLITESPRTQARLFRYTIGDVASPDTDRWELLGIDSVGYGNQGAGGYDPVRKLYARTAKSASGWGLVVWSLQQPGPTNRSFFVVPTGSLPLNELFGMDFDTRRGVFVLWDGGPDVWYVTPASVAGGQWSAQKAARNAGGALPSQDDGSFTAPNGMKGPQHGVLGKWKYAADYDVFFGVINPTAGNVWVYKPVGWTLP